MALAAFAAGHLVALAAILATAHIAGWLLAGRWLERQPAAAGIEAAALSAALGLAAIAQLALLLGLAGRLRPVPFASACVLLHLAGWRRWRGLLVQLVAWIRDRPRRALQWVVAGALLLAPYICLALYPPVAFDETAYHLPTARAFAESGALPFLPDLSAPVFPHFAELLASGALLLSDDVTVHLIQLAATLLTAALLFAWGRGSAGRAAGWTAAAIYLGNPIAASLAATAYVEPALALFVTAALHAGERFRTMRSAGWLVLAAAFAGAASATKYLGLFFIPVVWALTALGPGRRPRGRDLALYLAVSLAVLAPTYCLILWFTGNPVFPYLPRLFGASPWDPLPFPHPSLAANLTELLRLPWDAAFARQRLNLQPPFSPVYLLGLPLATLAAWRSPLARRLLGLALVWGLVFLFLPRDSRYLTPVLPAVSLVLAVAAFGRPAGLHPPRAGWRLATSSVCPAAACLLLLLPGWSYAVYRIARQGPPPASEAQRDAYLAEHLPAYPAIQLLNRTRGRSYTLYALHAENMPYYARGRFLGIWNGPASLPHLFACVTLPACFRELRGFGAAYFLLPAGAPRPPWLADPGFPRLFHLIHADPGAQLFALAPPLPQAAPPAR